MTDVDTVNRATAQTAVEIDDFIRRMEANVAQAQHDIAAPMVGALGAGDMTDAKTALTHVIMGLAEIRSLRAELDKHPTPKRLVAIRSDFKTHQWDVSTGMQVVRSNTMRGNREATAGTEMAADAGLAVSKAVYKAAPDAAGKLLLAETENPRAQALMESGLGLVERVVAGGTAKLIGVSDKDLSAEIGTLGDAAIDSGIKAAAGLVAPFFGDTKKVSHVLGTLALSMSKEVALTLRETREKKLEPEELERELVAAAVKGYMDVLGDLVKELPALKENDLGKKVCDVLVKAITAGTGAHIKTVGTEPEAKPQAGSSHDQWVRDVFKFDPAARARAAQHAH